MASVGLEGKSDDRNYRIYYFIIIYASAYPHDMISYIFVTILG